MATDLPLQRQLPPAQPLLADILLALQGGTSTALGKSADSAPPDMFLGQAPGGCSYLQGYDWAIFPRAAHPSSAEH